MEIKPIGYIQTGFDDKFGIPRQSGRVDIIGRIIFYPEYRNPDALREIETFDYLWLIFDFSQNHREKWAPTVRPPRLGGNSYVGVFASRSPFRPNNLGLSSVKLERIEHSEQYGDMLIVSGCDLLNNTPIYDIKPYITYSDCHQNAKSGYADEFENYKLSVNIDDNIAKNIPSDILETAIKCLEDDPRPSYIDDSSREYGMIYSGYEFKFTVKQNELKVFDIIKKEC